MANYKLIVADTTYPAHSRMTALVAQHLAVSFGYPLRSFVPLADEVLVFNPNNKNVLVAPRAGVDKNGSTMAYTAEYLIGAMENPEVLCHTVMSDCGKVNAKIYTSGVEFSTTGQMSTSVFVPKNFLMKVAKSDNRKGLPLVSFEYNSKRRLVRVTRFDEEYLQGFEIVNRLTLNDEGGTFKKFCTDKIYGMDLVEFIQS